MFLFPKLSPVKPIAMNERVFGPFGSGPRWPSPSPLPQATRDVYVGNLPETADEAKVRSAMERFGPVVTVKMVKHVSKRYAFVTFREGTDAEAAVASKTVVKVDGVAVKLGWSTKGPAQIVNPQVKCVISLICVITSVTVKFLLS